VLTPHGHWTYGRLENQPLFSGPALCINLARQGQVAFAYDMVGYNDTVQTPHKFGTRLQQLWSFGPLGLQLSNSIRALDFLEKTASELVRISSNAGNGKTRILDEPGDIAPLGLGKQGSQDAQHQQAGNSRHISNPAPLIVSQRCFLFKGAGQGVKAK
jgi:hypothetical protein